jgi:endo-1,4-beta-D-glucanase Y
MNWSVDWSWWAKDTRQRELSDRLQAFFESRGIATYGNRYTLDGNPIDASHSTGLVAMNAVASLAATHPRARQFVEALWDLAPPSGHYRYYDGMLYLLALLHCGGEFRIWVPPPRPRLDGVQFPADQPMPRTDQNSLIAHAQLLEKSREGPHRHLFRGGLHRPTLGGN